MFYKQPRIVDGVSLGFGRVARWETVLVTCIVLVSTSNRCLHAPMVGAPTVPLGGHSGVGMMNLILSELADHPCRLDVDAWIIC